MRYTSKQDIVLDLYTIKTNWCLPNSKIYTIVNLIVSDFFSETEAVKKYVKIFGIINKVTVTEKVYWLIAHERILYVYEQTGFF